MLVRKVLGLLLSFAHYGKSSSPFVATTLNLRSDNDRLARNQILCPCLSVFQAKEEVVSEGDIA